MRSNMNLLPLNRRGRLRAHVIEHTVNSRDIVQNPLLPCLCPAWTSSPIQERIPKQSTKVTSEIPLQL